MKRVTFRLAITLLTFLIGVAITGLLAVHPFRPTEKLPADIPAVTELQVKPRPPEGWKKIDVKNVFSFYVPPDMKEETTIGCPFGDREIYGNQSLQVSYDYVSKGLMEYGYRGRLTCEFFERSPTEQTTRRISVVEVGGRSARQIFWPPGELKHSHISLCFILGDGALLKFGAGSGDERGMDVAKQVIDSIEFR
jgi:hypothetical protein